NVVRLYLFVADGAVYIIESERNERYPYHQTNQLFRYEGDGRLVESSHLAGPAFQLSEVGRGAAFGDINNDGKIDIVVANNNGPARVLLNQAEARNHWLEIRLVGVKTNRDGLGSRVVVFRTGEKALWRRVHTDGSYLSAADSRVHISLGNDTKIDGVGVQWLGGKNEIWHDVTP